MGVMYVEEEDVFGIRMVTPRQLQILELLATGISHKRVARQLHISIQTVKHHLTNVYDRLDVLNVTAAVAVAVANGWINPRVVRAHREDSFR